jgi:hypothetical protein
LAWGSADDDVNGREGVLEFDPGTKGIEPEKRPKALRLRVIVCASGAVAFSDVSELRHVWPVSPPDFIWESINFHAPNRFESARLLKAPLSATHSCK